MREPVVSPGGGASYSLSTRAGLKYSPEVAGRRWLYPYFARRTTTVRLRTDPGFIPAGATDRSRARRRRQPRRPCTSRAERGPAAGAAGGGPVRAPGRGRAGGPAAGRRG